MPKPCLEGLSKNSLEQARRGMACSQSNSVSNGWRVLGELYTSGFGQMELSVKEKVLESEPREPGEGEVTGGPCVPC